MLDFFPTPYPDELWYSILCRYHIATGNKSFRNTLINLADSGEYLTLISSVPSNAMVGILRKLPQQFFPMADIIFNHTLLSFFLRLYPKEYKENILNEILFQGNISLSRNYKSGGAQGSLMYCPECLREDKLTYNEIYWHRAHQIPNIPLCHKHYCHLKSSVVFDKTKSEMAYIENILGTHIYEEADFNSSIYERRITDYLYSHLVLPYNIGATVGYNNLSQALYNSGFCNISSSKSYMMNLEKVCNELYKKFGEEYYHKVMGDSKSPQSLHRLHKWGIYGVDRVAMLQALVGLSTEDLFGTPIDDVIYKKLLKIKTEVGDIRPFKRDIAKEVGVEPRHLDNLVKKYGIKPFWNNLNKDTENKLSLKIHIPDDIYEDFVYQRDKLGVKFNNHFALMCIKEGLKQIKKYENL